MILQENAIGVTAKNSPLQRESFQAWNTGNWLYERTRHMSRSHLCMLSRARVQMCKIGWSTGRTRGTKGREISWSLITRQWARHPPSQERQRNYAKYGRLSRLYGSSGCTSCFVNYNAVSLYETRCCARFSGVWGERMSWSQSWGDHVHQAPYSPHCPEPTLRKGHVFLSACRVDPVTPRETSIIQKTKCSDCNYYSYIGKILFYKLF